MAILEHIYHVCSMVTVIIICITLSATCIAFLWDFVWNTIFKGYFN